MHKETGVSSSSKSKIPAKVPVACPVCDAKKSRVLYEPWVDVDDPQKLYGAASGIRGAQTIVECESCDMIYESPRYEEKVILKGYESSEEAGHDSQYPMRVRSFLQALKSLGSKIPPKGAKVLDVGTAGGAFLEAATEYGYDATGLEPSQFLVDSGKKRGLKLEQGTITSHRLPLHSFDMVCLWDVIEHLVDPKRDLAEIRKLLKPGGILLINFPDIGTLPAKVAGKKFWWILSVHLHHFSKDSIKEICKRTGFSVFHIQPYWQTLEFGYLEDIAVHLKVPLSKPLKALTPKKLQKLPLPYWASQTTALARLADN